MTGRYVLHHNVFDYLMLGWMLRGNVNAHAVLMIWPCGCRVVEPTNR